MVRPEPRKKRLGPSFVPDFPHLGVPGTVRVLGTPPPISGLPTPFQPAGQAFPTRPE